MSRVLVIIPTVRQARPEFQEFMRNFSAALIHPDIDALIVDGSAGVAQTYNAHLDLLKTGRWDFLVKIDDDLLPPPGWWPAVQAAFEKIPHLGALGLDLAETEEGRRYVAEVNPVESINGIALRPVKSNVAGAFIAMRAGLALWIGPIPVVTGTRYQFYEDGWRCGQVKKRELRLGYLVTDPPARLLQYDDPAEYTAAKVSDVVLSRTSNIWRI
jgi:hypothetical protein